MTKIIDMMLKSIGSRLKKNNIDLEFNDKCKKYLLDKGVNVDYGARPLRRILTKEIEDKLSEELLEGKVKIGDRILVSVKKKRNLYLKA